MKDMLNEEEFEAFKERLVEFLNKEGYQSVTVAKEFAINRSFAGFGSVQPNTRGIAGQSLILRVTANFDSRG